MRRVVSLWLPTLATDRLRRSATLCESPRSATLGEGPRSAALGEGPRSATLCESPRSAALGEGPLVTRTHDGRRMVIASADAAAQAMGLHAGMALAHAQALVPGLAVHPADPAGDAAALARLAAWCLRLSPLTAPETDGIWIDTTGCAHLHGGEAALLATLRTRLAQEGIAAHAAVADTPGAAHALARHGAQACIIVPSGGGAAAIAGLPIAALRLESSIVAGLRRLGFETIGALVATPRGPLARRFGPTVLLRLDQAHGTAAEPITPVIPPETPAARATFAEPLLTAEAFATALGHLARQACAAMEGNGQGARQVDALFERVDGTVQALRIGTAQPSRDPGHLAQMLAAQIERVDPGLGVEAMHLIVSLAEPLAYAQTASLAGAPEPDLSALMDRLANRLGPARVWRAAPVESDVPERSVRQVPPLAPPGGRSWPPWPRPARLLTPPQPVEALALLPDQPPAAFTWRRHRHRVRRADGPERITGEWWRRDAEGAALRDYWQVEDENGRRFWLYRRGDGMDPATGDLRWFMHGVF